MAVRIPHTPSPEWLVGGGETGDLVRSTDWAATSLGPRGSWPPSLRAVVNLLVASRVPMVLTWGRELVLLYNDAYREIAARKHPGILGRPLREAWPEIWDVIEPIFTAVGRGETVYQEDALYVLERRGFREEAYFTVCYIPVRVEDGRVGGTLVTHQETTKVLAERALARQALREQTALLRAISDTSADVIFAKDREGRMRFANPATLALVGRALEAVIGKTDEELLDDREAARQLMENDRRVMETGDAQELEERVPLPDGTERIWSSRKTPYRDDTGAIVGLLGVSRDITERKRTEQALREMNQRLREADLRKDEFLSAASHELRTPLATLRIHTDTLARMFSGPPLDEARVRRKLDSMGAQLDRLQGLVHALLDVTRISAGRLRLERQRCDLAQLAAEAVERFEDPAERAGVALALDATPALGVWDPLRLDQVLTNLLDNALKHAPGSRVEVSVRPAAGTAVLTVRDFGAGISAESQARIFQQYERAAEVRVFGGLGLGLWISRQIVEAHGGTISVESAPGVGSSFVVTLPGREDR